MKEKRKQLEHIKNVQEEHPRTLDGAVGCSANALLSSTSFIHVYSTLSMERVSCCRLPPGTLRNLLQIGMHNGQQVFLETRRGKATDNRKSESQMSQTVRCKSNSFVSPLRANRSIEDDRSTVGHEHGWTWHHQMLRTWVKQCDGKGIASKTSCKSMPHDVRSRVKAVMGAQQEAQTVGTC